MPSSRFFDNLPTYMQLFDDQDIVKFICDVGIQPEFNTQLLFTQQLEGYFDPKNPLSFSRLDWLGQLVGLGAINGHYLGIGINPSWQNSDKIALIENAWEYWKKKGTIPGIRQAIALWLLWKQEETQLVIKKPLEGLQSWWQYGTPYDYNWNKSFSQLKYLGSGDYSQVTTPQGYELTQGVNHWQYGVLYNTGDVEASLATPQLSAGSRLGSRHVWLDFECTEDDWRQLFPDYHELALEIFPVLARQAPFIYYNLPSADLALPQQEFEAGQGTKEIILDVDGYHFGWHYPYSAFFNPEPYFTETTVVNEWGIYPGFGYGEQWGSLANSYSTTTTETVETQGYALGCAYGDRYGARLIEVEITSVATEFDTTLYSMNYGDSYLLGYWYNSTVEVITAETTEIVTKLGIKPWHGISYTSINPVTTIINVPAIAALPWYVNFHTSTEVIRTEIIPPPYTSCQVNGSIDLDIQTGVQSTEIVTPAIPPNIKGILTGATTEIVLVSPAILGTLGAQWNSPYLEQLVYFSDIVSAFDNELTLEGLTLDTIEVNQLLTTNNLIDISGVALKGYQFSGQAEVTETVITPPIFNLVQGYLATYYLSYGLGKWYPYQGNPEVITITQTPVYETVKVCNTPARWSTKKIISYQEIIIPPSQVKIPLLELYPSLGTALQGNQWRVLIETDKGLFVQHPTIIRLEDIEGATILNALGNTGESLVLEFVANSRDCLVRSITVLLENKVIISRDFIELLDWSNDTTLVIKADISLQYAVQ